MTVPTIPAGWDRKFIKAVARITTGDKDTKDRVDSGLYPFFVRSQTVERINSIGFDGEGVLTAGDGVGTGKIFHYINGKFDFHQRVYLMHSFSEGVSGRYFFYYFSYFFYDRIMAMTAKSSVDSVRREMIADMEIMFPIDCSEQERVVAALSDADGVVAGLERLIAKKRLIKQGAMQDLLTARRRLPGFSGEWEYKSLGSVSAFITKGATPTTYGFEWQRHGVLFLRSECVGPLGLDLSQSMFICEDAHKMLNRSEVRSGDVLVTITGNVGRVVRLPAEFGFGNINQHIARIRVSSESSNGEYVFHQLSQQKYVKYFNSIVTGQAYPQISLRQVRDAVLPFPSLKEQHAIAAVLSDMDAEIQTLEARLAKARAIKEGMMQNLLTGRVRLV